MIVCTNCGNHNEDTDEFCGSCGKFLEWVGERVEGPAAKVAEPEPEEEVDTKVGIIDRVKAAVGVESSGAALPAEPAGPTPEELELEAAAAAAAAEADAEQRRLEAEAAEAERRAALAEEEAQRRIQAEVEAKAKAEEEAKVRAEAEAQAKAEAEERRRQELEAERKAQEEAASLAAAQAEAERSAEAARQAQVEAERAAATEAERQAAEAEAARQAQEAREAAEALEAAKRAEELARAAAEAEAAARAEAEAKAKAEAEARKQAEEDAKRRAEDEARARIAAEQRAREEEAARKRAAALLARPKAPAAPVEEVKPADDPFVTPPVSATPSTAATAAMTPAAAAAAATAAQKPAAQTPVAQQPSTAKAPPRRDTKQTAAVDTIKEGDLVCSQCGSGNDPTRKFCRKCGNSLAKAVPAKKLPWWKKLFGGKKVRTSKEAGARDARRRKATDASFKAQMVMSNLKKILLVAMMLGLVGGNFYFPSARGEITRRLSGGIRSVQDMFNPQVVPVNSLEPTATSAVPGKEAKFAADLVVNTYWAEAAEGDGVGETITFTFAEPTDLTKVLLTVGSTDTTENFLNNPRPKKLHLVFDNGGSADLDLEDEEFRKAQGFNLKGAGGVKKVDIVISEVYPGRGGTETGIAEVEFKKKG